MKSLKEALKQKEAYAADLFDLDIPASIKEKSKFPVRTDMHYGVPDIDPGYLFRPQQIAMLRFFFRGEEKAILLTGDTGTGKTSLIEQSAARCNWPVITVGCHERLELQELIGRITITESGATGWQDGPVIQAMREGAILLLDEGNFLEPGAVGGLNRILDTLRNVGGASYHIPETGELVEAHPDFRIAMTGNAINGVGKSSYRGTKPLNQALLDRFTLGLNVAYMSADEEVAMLKRRSPSVNPPLISLLVEVAGGVRGSFADGSLRCTISTRVLSAVCAKLNDCPAEHQASLLNPMLDATLLFRVMPEDRASIQETVAQVAQRQDIKL